MATPRTTQLPVRERGCCAPVAPPLADAVVRALADVHKAMADPTRLQILHMLKAAEDPICVCDFTAAFGLSQPTVSHHLARLRDAGLVASTKSGVWTYHRLREDMPPAARAALALVP